MEYCHNLKTSFRNISNLYKGHIAIEYSDGVHTYQELDNKSNAYVNYLISNNIGQGDVVAIASTKVFEDYALMVACLKSGITYVNLDIENPNKRLEGIFEVCQPKILFSKVKLNNISNLCKVNNIKHTLYDSLATFKDESLNLNSNIDGDTIAYIMFTSGSTGVPKGVAITHQNIIHFINWIKNKYSIQKKDKFANISPMYFDNSVFDFYGALFNGATLVPIKKELQTHPIELVEYVSKLSCTIWFSVPSMLIYLTTMRVLSRSNLNNIRVFTFGGEGYPKRELKKLYDIYSTQADFINVYGPTECTCICSSYKITIKDFENYDELPSLGRVNQNFSYVILDEKGEECILGELCLLGPNVGVGYFNELEKTNKCFMLFTNGKHYEKRMYKTGDLVKEKKGLLFFKGRIDNQIKHMGYRIELEEIEFALNSLKEISEGVVLYKRTKSTYGKITAFVTLNNKIEGKDIKKKLEYILPAYMIPSHVRVLKKIPKNQNGKTDKVVLMTEL
jgi:D-alanine--poly(phosphoribitol) ligase subunit 1